MLRALPAIAVSALVLAGAAAGQASLRDFGPQSSPTSATAQRIQTLGELEQQTLLAINEVRRQHGLVPLRLNRALASAARRHSRSMAQHGFFEHDSWDGSQFWQRIELAYPQLPGHAWATGENLVWASPDLSASSAIEMWLKSPPHRKNLLA